MTFKTTEKNTFKHDPLRGLEVNQRPVSKCRAVEIFALALALMVIVVGFRMCTGKPQVITLSELNADRR